MSTITDIARQTGFSIATVSRVLNGRTDVSPDTRERVLRTADAMNYQPHSGARNLRRRASTAQGRRRELTHTVGLLFLRSRLFDDQPFFGHLAAAVEEALRHRGIGLAVITASGDGGVPREVRDHAIDGVIAWGSAPVVKEAGAILPTVTVDIYDPELGVYGVAPDYCGGVREAVARLLAAGHRRIALLTGDPAEHPAYSFSQRVHRGCVEAFDQAGLPLPADPHPAQAFRAAEGYAAGLRLLGGPRSDAPRPDALVASDGAMLGVCRAAYELGLRIPRDISLVGIDGIAEGEFYAPPLTTVDTHIAQLGATAVRALMAAIHSGASRVGMELVPASLLVRESARL